MLSKPRMLIEVLIDEKLCNEASNPKFSKQEVCYQLERRLKSRINQDQMFVLINVSADYSKMLEVNFHNYNHLNLYKKDIDGIKELVVNELGAYLDNPEKQIMGSIVKQEQDGGALYRLLRENNAALNNKDKPNQVVDDSLSNKGEVEASYNQQVLRYNAFKRCERINELLSATFGEGYEINLNTNSDIFIPDYVFSLSIDDKPVAWFNIEAEDFEIMETVTFLRGMGASGYIETSNGVKQMFLSQIEADEYVDQYDTSIGYIQDVTPNDDGSDSEDIETLRDWAEGQVGVFIGKLYEASDIDEEAYQGENICFLDPVWQTSLTDSSVDMFLSERKKAIGVIIQKIIAA